jgi:DNA polymerase-3 subunit alpha
MVAASDFTHLHLHSQYSLLDGAIRMDELVPAIAEKGMTSVAVTDHGNMFGAIHFYKTAKKHGIKPILGCEAYVAGAGRHDRKARDSAHLVLLAKDNEGYKNLSYLISMGYMEGFYYNPRIDKEILKKHSKGLYGLSACLGGVVNKTYLREGEAKAAAVAKEYAELFEPDHFFLELQDNGYEAQVRANQALMNIGQHYNIPMVATADSHYLRPQDSDAHEILMCIGHGQSLQEFRGKMQHSDLLYVRDAADMYRGLGSLCPQALENTVRIAKNCNVELNLSETFLPSYGVPQGMSRESYLEQLTRVGLKRRIKEALYAIDVGAYSQRLDYELGVITKMGFAGYFLIVWDFIRYAKETSVPVGPGRGSGAGSLVAWCLRITDLDPIPYDLLFERFLNPERVSMPDFDIDFCQDRRGEVLDYVSQKYGKQNVGQIVTYSQLSAKSVIKDVGRVLQLPFAEVNELTKLIPGLVNGKKVSIEQALKLEPKLRDIQKEKPIYAQVINIARSLEGLNRQTGMHAAGIVIGDRPLWEYVPVCRGKEGELITQFAKDEVEEAGLVKFDFLGLKTLTVIAGAEAHVRRRPGDGPLGPNCDFHVERAPLADARVYALISSGDTDGVFQLESSGFKELLKRLRPDCFEDIVAAVALYRPGPLDAGMVDDYIARKHGRKKVAYPHPVCESILNTTYGVIVYQEQVMRIAVALSGFSMGEADILRKAMGKKKADVMAQVREKFVSGAQTQSQMPRHAADELFTQIEKFAGYAFNKSHSAAYAVISYQTAYLKTYYPVEFMAALLSTEMGDQDNVVRYITSAREHRISVLPPCVNQSDRDFAVVNDATGHACILFGLGAVKGVGDAAIDSIIESRKDKPFVSLYDFCEQVDLKKVNRRVLEALVKSGACAAFNRPRAQLFATVDKALETGQKANKDRAVGQTSLFAAFAASLAKTAEATGGDVGTLAHEVYPELPEWSDRERLSYEKEALGFYITGHPLDTYVADLPRLCTANTATLAAQLGGAGPGAGGGNFGGRSRMVEVALGGVVVALRERPLKNGNGRMAFVTLEDLHGSCEVLVFSKVFADSEMYLKSDEPVLVRGALMVEGDDEQGSQLKIRATSIEPLCEVRRERTQGIRITLPVERATPAELTLLKQILKRHFGPVPVRLTLVAKGEFEADLNLSKEACISPTEQLLVELNTLLGQGAVALS